MGRIKKHLLTIVIGLVFLAGVCMLLYPTVASWWNGRVQSHAVSKYNEAISQMQQDDHLEQYAQAKAYNDELFRIGSDIAIPDPDLIEGYSDILSITATGVMGYVTIDKINARLPIYHGTSDSSLLAGAGHIEGSSFPIGGENTHCVISAHRGLPSARMFTDLDKLDIGDTFELHVLGDTLAYEIDQIVTVLPNEIKELYIHKGEDLCTLMTCTPYGVNTHRLLLRGHRVQYDPEDEDEEETPTVTGNDNRSVIIIAAVIGAVVLVLVLLRILVMFVRKKK